MNLTPGMGQTLPWEWRDILDAMDDPVFVHDEALRLVYANRAYLQHAGAPFSMVRSRPYWQVFPHREGPPAMCSGTLQQEDEAEEIVDLPDGTIFRMRAFYIHGAYGYALHIMEDVTELTRVQENLRELTHDLENRVRARTADLIDERRFADAVLDTAETLIVVLDDQGGIVRMNRACEVLTGRLLAEVRGRSAWEVFVPPERREEAQRLFRRLMEVGRLHHQLTPWLTAQDAQREIEWSSALFQERNRTFAVAAGVDVTARLKAEREVARAYREQTALMQAIPDVIYVIDPQGQLVKWNRRLEALTGLKPDELQGCDAVTLFPETQRKRMVAAFQAGLESGWMEVEADILDCAGDPVPHHFTGVRLTDAAGNLIGLSGVGRDITERRRLERDLRELATVDHLTRAYNRAEIDRLMQIEMARTERYHHPLSLLLFDLDHFKQVNDRLGHHAGDRTLRATVAVVREHIRASDHIGRWGGEEFLVLLPAAPLAEARRLAEKLRRLIAEQAIPGVGTITASFGVTTFRPDESAESFTRRADDLLYTAKRAGRNRVEAG